MKMNFNNKNVFKCLYETTEKFDLFRAKVNLIDSSAQSKQDIIDF